MSFKPLEHAGIGTLPFIFSILAILVSFTFVFGKSIGEHMLDALKISFLTGVISLVLFIISIIIGYKYKQHALAKVGRNISIAFILLMVILTIVSIFYT